MASDDESTQPIDIEALRSALPSKAATPRPPPAAEDAGLPPAVPEADARPLDEQPPEEATGFGAMADDRTAIGAAPISGLSFTNIGSLTQDDEAAPTVSPPWTTRVDMPPSVPGTVPAHELVSALVTAMGAPSQLLTWREDGLDQTDERETRPPAGAGRPPRGDEAEDTPREDPGFEPEMDTEAALATSTSTRLPVLKSWADDDADVEATSVSARGPLPRPNAPRVAPSPLDDERTLAGVPLSEEPAATTEEAPVIAGDEQPLVDAPQTPRHPADEPDQTRMGHLDQAGIRAAFAAAEASESTSVFVMPGHAERAGTTPDGGLAPDQDSAPRVEAALPSDPNIVEVSSMELESLHDLLEVDDRTGEIATLAPMAPPLVPSFDEPLPPFAEPRPFAEPEAYDDDGGATLFRPSARDADTTEREAAEAEAAREARATAPPMARPSAPPPRLSAPPPAPPYQPPAPIGRTVVPAYANDTDDDEDQLQSEGGFGALLDLYRMRLVDADTPLTRAALLHKIASVYEYQLGEPERAFTALLDAFEMRPGDDDIVASLDRVARATGRAGELADRARRNLHTADLELKVILLGHLVFWYERLLNRGAEIGQFVSELERLDKSHPVVLRRAAQHAAASGDVKTQRELLVRALDRTARRDDKVALYLALAGAHAGTPEATRHYEAAVATDATSIPALQGLERIGREQGKHGQVEWCLERQVEVGLSGAERIDALMKLADLQETKFVRRERAAETLQRVLEIEPSHPQALKALERCYHALRDWARLVQVLRARAANASDRKQKVELLELAAEVFEAKLGDAASAIEVHRDLLVVDPKHRRALADLARLYEKLGDWGNLATYKARVAELAPTKRQASQLLVQLGDFLSAPDRDSIAARLQYERAVVIDPTNAAAWEALQRLAAEAGDDRRVAQCLAERGKYVDGPRQRAAIYVELASLHQRTGDERAARQAFEQAALADPTNEVAAVTMLDVYTREEKWKEAAPLCDLLVNAATRDKDPRILFTRLRLATRIAAALGDADRAMTSALAALELEPDDQGAQADLVAVGTQCRESPRVVLRAKEWLARIADGPGQLPSSALVGLAQLQRDAGDVDGAAASLERALEASPDDPAVLTELAEAYLAQGDFPRVCKLKVDMARNATSADERFRLLCEVGEIWARRADELDKAATIFEEARRIKPLDSWLLHTLMWLYSERHRWDDLSSVLEGISQLHESPERKAMSLFAMAQVVLEKVCDLPRAAQLFDQVLDIDKKRLDAFELQVRALTEAKDWEALELAYRKMIGRLKEEPEPNTNLQFALFQQLGLIYRDRLEDAERAYEALEAAARLRPDDAAVRKIVTELLVVTDNLDNAVLRVRELITRDPHDAELYAELYELFLRQRFFDKAWCTVNVLAQMREPSAEQRRFHEDYAPMPLGEVPGQIVEQAWRSHVLHADLHPTLTALFSRITPAVARMRYTQLRPDQLVYAVGRPFTVAHSRLYEAVRVTFANAAEILCMTPPDLLLGDPSSPVPFAPALAPFGAVQVSVPAVEARAESLAYVIGKRLAEQRPELIARAFFPAVSDLASLLGAAVRVSRQEGAKDAAGAALDASFEAILMPHEREGIRAVVAQATMEGGLVDVKRWSQAADLSSMRAGLLLCGDVAPARKTILAEPQSTADLPPREKIAELYAFATSDLYSDLRGAIGVAVQG